MHESIWNNVTCSMKCNNTSYGYTAFKYTKCSHMHILVEKFMHKIGLLNLKMNYLMLNIYMLHATFSLPTEFFRNTIVPSLVTLLM